VRSLRDFTSDCSALYEYDGAGLNREALSKPGFNRNKHIVWEATVTRRIKKEKRRN